MSEADPGHAIDTDDVFIVSAEQQEARHRLEAVVPSDIPGKWYERVVLNIIEDSDELELTCTCPAGEQSSTPSTGTDQFCPHASAALHGAASYVPGVVPGRRRAEEVPQLHIGTSTQAGDWFDLDVTVTLGGEEIDFKDLFAALVRGEQVYLLPDGTYFSLHTPELDTLRRVIDEARTLNEASEDGLRVNRYQADLLEELAELEMVEIDIDSSAENTWWRRLAHLDTGVELLDPPEALTADLRDYQQYGYSWLSFLYEQHLGGLLADDMGLGKTVQALAMIQRAVDSAATAEEQKRPFLIVAPTSVVGNWATEAQRFTPDLNVVVLSETARRSGRALADMTEGADIVLTSYALFRMEAEDYQQRHWAGLILDEAQMIKNPSSRGYRAAREIRSDFTLAITGTPLENSLQELWALVSLCCPGLLGRRDQFNDVYRVPIEKERDQAALARLKRRLRPFLLRRTKETVAAELPPKQEQELRLSLHPEHRAVYDRRLQRERQRVLGLMQEPAANRFEILAALNQLRQLALDTELVGETPAPSAKLETLVEMLQEVTGEGHRVLVLSQYTRFLSKARQAAEEAQVPTSYLDGSTTGRDEVIEAFREGRTDAFFISLKAGGFGLNLVEADYVVLLDPWWNPAAEEQAIDRAHRIGQQRTVMVYRLVAEDTIESKVMALQQSKQELFDRVLGDGSGGQDISLSAEDIRDLLS